MKISKDKLKDILFDILVILFVNLCIVFNYKTLKDTSYIIYYMPFVTTIVYNIGVIVGALRNNNNYKDGAI